MQRYARRNGTGGNGVLSVRSKRPTGYSRNLTQIQTGLGIAVILVQGSEEPVPWEPTYPNCQSVSRVNSRLYGQVIVDRVLIAQG